MTSGDMSDKVDSTTNSGGGKDNDALSSMPEVFEFQFMPSDLESVFSEILMDTKVGDVFDAFSQHIGDTIEPLGWKAVWKPSTTTAESSGKYPEDTSFRVNVINVFYQTMEASVSISDLLFPKLDTLPENEAKVLQPLLSNNCLQPKVITVQLQDLFVISESQNDAQYHDTAYLIELVRFFYRNVWRPWDGLEDDVNDVAGNFVATRLMPRLKMFWEMKNGIISKSFIRRAEAILAEATHTRVKLDALTERIETAAENKKTSNSQDGDSMESGDELSDIDDLDSACEIDALQYVRLKMKLQEFEREMSIIEDAQMRSIYHTLLPNQPIISEETIEEEELFGDQEAKKNKSLPVMHLVSKSFTLNTLTAYTAKLTKLLGMNNTHCNWPLKLHDSLQQAITAAGTSGDVIFLTEGTYREPLAWLEKDLEIVGIDDDVTILSHVDSGDVLLFVDVPSTLKLTNLTIRASHSLNHLIVAKTGVLVLNRCKLDCASLTTGKAVLVTDKAVLKMDRFTTVIGEK